MIEKINIELLKFLSEKEILHHDKTLKEMIYYSVGFDPDGNLIGGGKRLRPIICGLVSGSLCGDWEISLPFGISLELLHNFTLIHDDIEDQSDTRHRLPTLWKKWGLPLSLNAGDLLFAIAYQSILDAATSEQKSKAIKIFDRIIQNLILGQHRDISFEKRDVISEDEYFSMIHGKTVSLFGGCCAFGALAAGADDRVLEDFTTVGEYFGYAFQIRDDFLGIWGDTDVFGKSVSSDITSKKMTLPIVYGLEKDSDFKKFWTNYSGDESEVQKVNSWLKEIGADKYTEMRCQYFTDKATCLLRSYTIHEEYQKKISELFTSLLDRKI
mgnify:CR=1 FL=1